MADGEEQRGVEDMMAQGRSRKLIEKALEDKLQKYIALRRRKLGTLTSTIREFEILMRDARNVQNVQDAMEKDFAELVGEFRSLNSEVANLLREDERTCDQDNWFEVKMAPIREFMKETKRWIAAVHESTSVLPMENVQ